MLFSLVILSCSGTSQEELIKQAGAPLLKGMGNHTHKITTTEGSQKYFNQGLTLSFAFNHAESIRSFQASQRLDPNCAMCYWGEALSRGPNINVTSDGKVVMSPQDRKEAFKAINKAKELMPLVSQKEQDTFWHYLQDITESWVQIDQFWIEIMLPLWRLYQKNILQIWMPPHFMQSLL